MLIRDALPTDIPAITDIYNQILTTSTAIFSDQPSTPEQRLAWLETRRTLGYPVLVATEQQTILGFASFGDFRSGPGYRFTVEHTIHIHPSFRGHGIGTQLLSELITQARAAGKHAMVGGVDAENLGSLRFHERLGFERVAYLRQVGYKFNRYLDLILLQYLLTPQ